MSDLTVKKKGKFLDEPMGDKPVTKLAGIGEKIGNELAGAGFDTAYTLFGQFLVLDKNRQRFTDWLKKVCSVNAKQADDCYDCLNDWGNEYLGV